MRESLVNRLSRYEGLGMLAVFFGQYLSMITGPFLIVLGLGIWNPVLFLGGLISLRLFFACCDLQQALADRFEKQGRAEGGT